MASEWMGKEESWKQHSRPLAQAALKKARGLGFRFRPSKGKPFGRLRCPSTDPGDTCETSIYSTSQSEDGSATALVIERLIRDCRHLSTVVPDGDDEEQLTCEDLSLAVYRCGCLLDAVEELVESAEYERRFEEHFHRAEEFGDEIELASAEEMDALARERINRAQGLAAQADRDVERWPPPEGAADLLNEVSDRLDEIDLHWARLDCDSTHEGQVERLRGRYLKIRG